MYGKYIGSLFMEDFTVLQKEEIRQGLDEGLDQEVIYLFARPYYNFLQMREIRTALKEGIDPDLIRRYWKPSMDYSEMKEMRIAAVSMEPLPVRSFIPAAAAGFLLFSAAASLCFYFVTHPKEHLALELKAEEAELAVGEMFDPMEYVLSYSGDDALLVLPHGITTDQPGSRTAVYELKGKRKSLTRTLRVTVSDKKKKAPQESAVPQ